MKSKFTDSVMYDSKTKTVVSVRDGILEYHGAELGIEPFGKVFKVYRSPETTHDIAAKMVNIPVTNGHIELTDIIPSRLKEGFVLDSVFVEMEDTEGSTTVKIRNKVTISDSLLNSIRDGKKELSLGYNADLVETDIEGCDYEQKNIEPHHLAVVEAGRCGNMCTFLDGKKREIMSFISFGDNEINDALNLNRMGVSKTEEALFETEDDLKQARRDLARTDDERLYDVVSELEDKVKVLKRHLGGPAQRIKDSAPTFASFSDRKIGTK